MITYRGSVYPWYCDQMGHMNVMWYTHMFDGAAWNFFAEIGITPSYIREKKRGPAAVEHRVQYKKELFAGDVVIVETQLIEIREKVIRFNMEILNLEKKETAATAEFTGVHLDSATHKACPFPQEVLERAKALKP